MTDLHEFEDADRTEELRRTIDRLTRELNRTRVRREEQVEAIYRAALDGIRGLNLPKVPPPRKDPRRKGAETAVAVLSDWQLAKVTPSYDSQTCAERVATYGDKLLDLVEIQRADHPVKELRVWLLGDIVEGELIFPGQAHLIDASLYRQVTVDGPRILAGFLRRMAAHFERVHVTAVIGNHGALGGRSRRDYDPESNADRMLYRICQQICADVDNVTWSIPDGGRERNWYALDRIGDTGFLLFHGDQIRGHSGFPWYGFGKKVQGWRNGAIPEPFDEAVCGHWHQPTTFVLNRVRVRVNGSTESDNTYAQEQLAAVGRPSQWLIFVHPKRGVTAEYVVWLDV